jgi:Tfp pilus assembly protein FimT
MAAAKDMADALATARTEARTLYTEAMEAHANGESLSITPAKARGWAVLCDDLLAELHQQHTDLIAAHPTTPKPDYQERSV